MSKVMAQAASDSCPASPEIALQRDGDHLARLTAEFCELRRRLATLDREFAVPICGREQLTPESASDSQRLDEIDRIREQLYELSWQIADIRARSLQSLKLKAQVLDDRCNEDHSDVVAALARSISKDILLMSRWPG